MVARLLTSLLINTGKKHNLLGKSKKEHFGEEEKHAFVFWVELSL